MSKPTIRSAASGPATATRVVVATTVMLSFISFWRAAAIVLNDLASSAYYAGGIAEQAVGRAAPWMIFGVMLFSYAVRAVYVESCAMFTRGGVYRVVKEAMGGTLAKLSVSALMFDYILTGPISGVSAGQYVVGLVAQAVNYFGYHWHPDQAMINHIAAVIAVEVTIYFWWRNTLGIRESSEDALRIMKITTVMVIVLIGWGTLTFIEKPETRRLPPAPIARNLNFSRDAVGWLPKLAPGALRETPAHAGEEPRLSLVHNAGMLLGLIGILMAFGHSFLAMSGEESLAQVNRELEHPKHRNLMRAGLVIFAYSLVLTSFVSFTAYAVIPDNVRPHFYDNLIAGISMYLVGPTPAKLLFQAFIVLVGFLMLSGAINTAIVGANGVLNRVSEDGVMPDWLRAPHRKYGTTYRMINLIVILQLVAIVASRGETYTLGEAYAFGVVWSFAFKGLAMLVLRFKDKSVREWKVPGNLRVGRVEIPIVLFLIALVLFAVAGMNLVSKQVATISGTAFTIVFFILFASSERIIERKRKSAHVEMDQFQLAPQEAVSTTTVGARPGNALCYVRDYNSLDHLTYALNVVDTAKRDIVVMTTQLAIGPGSMSLEHDSVFTSNEQLLFSRVVAVAERAGKHVKLLVTPAVDADQAIAQTAVQLGSTDILAGRSPVMGPEDQAKRLGQAWERVADDDSQAVRFRVIGPENRVSEFSLGAHAPVLADEDVSLIHDVWLDMVQEPHLSGIHHRDVVALALARIAQDLGSAQRARLLDQMQSITTLPAARSESEHRPQSGVPRVIMVPALDVGLDTDAAEFAGHIARATGAAVRLVYPAVVPRQLPLMPPAGEDKKTIQAKLRRMEVPVRGMGLPVVHMVEPTRDAARCILQVAQVIEADMLVLAVPHEMEYELEELVETITSGAACEVILVRQARAQSNGNGSGNEPAG
jgi:amino acid transporter